MSRDVIGHMTIGFSIGYFLLVFLWNQADITVSEIFNGECDSTVDMTLNDFQTNVKVIHFGINRFITYDFL